MKLNKLLTPILGLATVSTVIVPIATSCSAEQTVDHVKISNKSEEVTPNSSGLANYLFVLDSSDYDEHGFKVTTTVDSKDTSGVVDSDFTTTWEIDGDHLLVHVQYEGEEAPEEDVAIKLNIHINYGTEWNKTFDVKFNYVATKAIEMVWDANNSVYLYDGGKTMTFETGKSYIFKFKWTSSQISLLPKAQPNYFRIQAQSASTPTQVNFTVTVKLNGEIVDETKYTPASSPISPSGTTYAIDLLSDFRSSLSENDIISIECNNCIVTQLNIASGGYDTLDKIIALPIVQNR